jgi:uncharacterized lipoprotein YajG
MSGVHPWRSLLLTALAALLAGPATAKKDNPNLALVYTPTTAVAEASATPTSEMRAIPAALLISDDRSPTDKTVVGSRTDDDDRRTELKATNDVVAFVESALTKQARAWGFVIATPAEAGVLLVGKIIQLQIDETNQAVGATYSAEVTLDFELRDRAGKNLASGSFFGDASRYGKKFSAQNANEVLSDALAEAVAKALDDPNLRAAWAGTPTPAATAGGDEPLTPEGALQRIKGMIRQGASESEVQDFLRRQTLTRALGAEDLAAWQEAGVPESITRVAMTLRVR